MLVMVWEHPSVEAEGSGLPPPRERDPGRPQTPRLGPIWVSREPGPRGFGRAPLSWAIL